MVPEPEEEEEEMVQRETLV